MTVTESERDELREAARRVECGSASVGINERNRTVCPRSADVALQGRGPSQSGLRAGVGWMARAGAGDAGCRGPLAVSHRYVRRGNGDSEIAHRAGDALLDGEVGSEMEKRDGPPSESTSEHRR